MTLQLFYFHVGSNKTILLLDLIQRKCFFSSLKLNTMKKIISRFTTLFQVRFFSIFHRKAFFDHIWTNNSMIFKMQKPCRILNEQRVYLWEFKLKHFVFVVCEVKFSKLRISILLKFKTFSLSIVQNPLRQSISKSTETSYVQKRVRVRVKNGFCQ